MTDRAPSAPRTRGHRTALVVTLILIAFAAGLVLMGIAVRRVHWLQPDESAATRPVTSTTANQFTPAAPLDANGEPNSDPAVLATREAALAAQLTALEARTAAVSADAAAASGQAGRAEAVLTLAATRRAIDRGQPLGYLEEQLRQRFGTLQPRAVNYLIQAAHHAVTLEDLRQGLDAIAPEIAGPADDGWFSGLRREMSTLIVLHKAGTPSPLPADRLDRIRRLLDAGQVQAARAEVQRLPGVDDAANWMTAAERYILARRALDILENTALSMPVTPPSGSTTTTTIQPTS